MQSVGVLCIESNFYSLDLVTQFDGGTKLQLHAFLHCWQRQQQKGLAIDVLVKKKDREMFLFVDSGGQKEQLVLEKQEEQFAPEIKGGFVLCCFSHFDAAHLLTLGYLMLFRNLSSVSS